MKLIVQINISCYLLALICFSSCSKDEDVLLSDNTSVLIYMCADNNLSNNAYLNIESIINSSLNVLKDNKLLIYYDPIDSNPKMIEIYQEGSSIKKKIIYDYEEHNSASGEVLSRVINDAFSLYQSNSKGIILWSHGTAWLPSSETKKDRSFGLDGKNEMELTELAKALPDNFFDFIIFDACLMNSIEVCYELRNKSKYIVGSPNEILAEGFPYKWVIPELFSENPLESRLISICDSFFNYYSSQNKYLKSASISLIKTDYLDKLANLCRVILNNQSDNIMYLDTHTIQPLHNLDVNNQLLFDFGDFISHIIAIDNQQNLETLLNNIIIYKKNTNTIYSSTSIPKLIPIVKYSGLSTYIPKSNYHFLNNWYFSLSWSKNVYGIKHSHISTP